MSRSCLRSATVMVVLALAVAACGRQPGSAPAAPQMTVEQANAAAQAWREKHEADYRRDWVTIAGLHPLREGNNTAGSARTNDIVLPSATPAAVGTFVRTGATVRFEPAPGAPVLVNGEPVTGPVDLHDDRRREPDELTVGEIRMIVHVSGQARSIRVWDPYGPQARSFAGFAWFPIDARYRTTGRLIKDAAPQRFTVLNTYGDADEYISEGVVEFQLAGQTLRLRPFTTRPNRFYFVFRDASSGEETYETARFLYSDLYGDGTTVLDFNVAYNPPCAFNPFTTCPIPLRENRLPVKILAGEKSYAGSVATPR